jgi:hypothetical protein
MRHRQQAADRVFIDSVHSEMHDCPKQLLNIAACNLDELSRRK